MTEAYNEMNQAPGPQVHQSEPNFEPSREDRPQIVSYWGMDRTERHFLPDKIQYFEFKIMNEGAKARFQKSTNKDLTITRDNNAKMQIDQANERHELITQSVTGWLLYARDARTGEMEQSAFSKQLLNKWLMEADPELVEGLEKAIRKANPWMQSEMTVEAIDEEIERLYELRKEISNKEAGESFSASK